MFTEAGAPGPRGSGHMLQGDAGAGSWLGGWAVWPRRERGVGTESHVTAMAAAGLAQVRSLTSSGFWVWVPLGREEIRLKGAAEEGLGTVNK